MARFGYVRTGGLHRRGGYVGGKVYSSIKTGVRVSKTTGKMYTSYTSTGRSLHSSHRYNVGTSSVNKAINNISSMCDGYDPSISKEANAAVGIITIVLMLGGTIAFLIALACCGLL